MVRMGVAGSIPAEGSTTNQQLRPGPAPGLFHARRASDRRLPTICQRVTTRSRVITLSGDHLERFAVWSGDAGCALSAPVRYSSSTSMGAVAPWCMALLGRLRVERRAAGCRSSVMASVHADGRGVAEYLQDVWRAKQGAVTSKDRVKSLCREGLSWRGVLAASGVSWEHPECSSWLPF